jgi:hypothetical protein
MRSRLPASKTGGELAGRLSRRASGTGPCSTASSSSSRAPLLAAGSPWACCGTNRLPQARQANPHEAPVPMGRCTTKDGFDIGLSIPPCRSGQVARREASLLTRVEGHTL